MKSLNDYIWNPEQLDVELSSPDCEVSSSHPLIAHGADFCSGGGVNFPLAASTCYNHSPSLVNCANIDPLLINGCITPMGVSCGGGGVPVGSMVGCISPGIGAADYCAS